MVAEVLGGQLPQEGRRTPTEGSCARPGAHHGNDRLPHRPDPQLRSRDRGSCRAAVSGDAAIEAGAGRRFADRPRVLVLSVEDPERFDDSRTVGAYLGLVPEKDQSGDSDPQRRISKRGDRMLRRLLVGSAHYLLGPFGEDSDLRRHGEKLAARGGKNAKKRAVVAVARKLSVLLHHLWMTGEAYEPLRNARLSQQSLQGI